MSTFGQKMLNQNISTMLLVSSIVLCLSVFIYIVKSESPLISLEKDFLLIIILVVIFAFTASFHVANIIFSVDCQSQKMKNVAYKILKGSQGYFKKQYQTISYISILISIILFIFYSVKKNPLNLQVQEQKILKVNSIQMAFLTATSFLIGCFTSGFSGYLGMWISIRTNLRVSWLATKSYKQALKLSLYGGYFGAILNVGMAIFGICLQSIFYLLYLQKHLQNPDDLLKYLHLIPLLLTGFGFGASLVAIFAQLGGGIFTKSADIGADLVGKVIHGLQQDDIRNPAVIADLVGDNVGDCAGQNADLFESISAQIISSMIIGSQLAQKLSLNDSSKIKFIFFPLAIHCVDIISSSIGVYFTDTTDEADLKDNQNPMDVFIRGNTYSSLTGITGLMLICYYLINPEGYENAWKLYFVCSVIGIIVSWIIIMSTQYYTDNDKKPVRQIVTASKSGSATNIIAGLSVGLQSTGIPLLSISIGLISSYSLGQYSQLKIQNNISAGLFATAVSTMGMFSSGVYILSISGFGPISDNAGGIIQMSGAQFKDARRVTDLLDAAGNTTKANAKGYSIGSASMACFLLFSAYVNQINYHSKIKLQIVSMIAPQNFVGGMLGSVTVFIFAAWSIQAVGKTAQKIINICKKQLTEQVMNYQIEPNYSRCINQVTQSGLKQMIKPGMLAVLSPILVTLIFKIIGNLKMKPLMGAEVTCAYLLFSTTTGILLALFFNNSGGAWDNAKKYIEKSEYKRNSKLKEAVVTGDTVGDPLKDTAGPSIHILIKLISTITLITAPLIV